MLPDYEDIKSKIKEEPQWYDAHGVPRYCKFHPEHASNIYSEEVLLVEISCQYCRKRFKVEFNWNKMDKILKGIESLSESMIKFIDKKEFPLHYGDPPRHKCNGCGETMNCYDLRILEFWRQNKKFDWERVKEFEIELERED